MEFSYTPDLVALKNRGRELTKALMAYEDECEFTGTLSTGSRQEVNRIVRDSGLLAMNAPVELGGAGLRWVEQVAVEEELGQLTNGLWAAVYRPAVAELRYCTPAQLDQYLLPTIRGERFGARAVTEPEAGSDLRGLSTVAVRTGDGYRLNGEKWFVTVGDVADYLLVLARVAPDDEFAMFFVEKNAAGVELFDTPKYTHNFAVGHPNIRFTDVEVTEDAVLGTVGIGMQLAMETFFEERVIVSAHAVGAAERALQLATEWARNREQGGERIIRRQLVQAMLADSALDIMLNRALVHQVAWELDRGGDPKTLSAKVAMAKLSSTEAAGRVADRAVQIFGGRGYRRDNPVERINREVRVDRIWMGTSEIQRIVIANEIDKRGLSQLIHYRTAESNAEVEATR